MNHQEPDKNFLESNILNPLSPNSPLNPMSLTYKHNFALDMSEVEWEKAKDELVEHTLTLYEKEQKLEEKDQTATNMEREQKEKSQQYYQSLEQAQILHEQRLKEQMRAMEEAGLKENISKLMLYINMAIAMLNAINQQVTQAQTIVTQQNQIIHQAHVQQLNHYLNRVGSVLANLSPSMILASTNGIPINFQMVNGQSQLLNQIFMQAINNMRSQEEISNSLVNTHSSQLLNPKMLDIYTGINPPPTFQPVEVPQGFTQVPQMVDVRNCNLEVLAYLFLHQHLQKEHPQITHDQVMNMVNNLKIGFNSSDFAVGKNALNQAMILQNSAMMQVLQGKENSKLLNGYIGVQQNCVNQLTNKLQPAQLNPNQTPSQPEPETESETKNNRISLSMRPKPPTPYK